MDFDGMRPDEWANSDAKRFQEFGAIRAAYRKGVQDAEDEYQATQDLKRELADG